MCKVMEHYEKIAREEGRAEGRAEERKLFAEERKLLAEEMNKKDEELRHLRAQLAALQGKKEASLFDDLREGLSEAIDYEKGELPARKTTLTILPADSVFASDIHDIECSTVPSFCQETIAAMDEAKCRFVNDVLRN